jgi:hypothetical protein
VPAPDGADRAEALTGRGGAFPKLRARLRKPSPE